MKPRLDPLDVIVAIGMFATIMGGLFFVVASYGVVGVGAPDRFHEPITPQSVMASLQTAMGENIVEMTKLDNVVKTSLDRVTQSVTHYAGQIESFNTKPPIAHVVQARFEQAKAEHEGQIQYLMGQSIVTLTGQGVRAGVLTPKTLSGPINDRIIATAKRYGELAEGRFNGQNQALMGQWITQESQSRQRLGAHLQERMGEAIVQQTLLDHTYKTTESTLGAELYALAAAATRMEATQILLAQLEGAQNAFRPSGVAATPSEPIQASLSSVWKELPVGLPLALLVILPAILIASLALPRTSLEERINMDRILELTIQLMHRQPVKSS